MKILIVEDDFASRKFMMDYMSKHGECDGTADGEEAVEAYIMAVEDDDPYDLICLDIMMPAMDGYQVLKAIREMENENGVAPADQVKIIMMTALSEEKNVMKAFEMGCSVYCNKPVDVERLESAMEKLGLL
ncbi:MAG: response regulator [Pseudobutyrivibrio sp.]|nr:response regulator [Pseudobutyrivibrio sp.]